MELEKNNSLFTDLTEDETAALNGGYHRCFRRFVRRCFRRWTWYGPIFVCRFVPVIICY
jgi:hypothetical protein